MRQHWGGRIGVGCQYHGDGVGEGVEMKASQAKREWAKSKEETVLEARDSLG